MPSLRIIYASTSGHTEYVVQTLVDFLRKKKSDLRVTVQQTEKAVPEDLLNDDVLLLASSTWNTGNVEGQLNPHMHVLLKEKAKDLDLKGKKVALIALGDERYHFRANARVHMEEFVTTHHGSLLSTPLIIINEPYGQEAAIEKWGSEFLKVLS